MTKFRTLENQFKIQVNWVFNFTTLATKQQLNSNFISATSNRNLHI